VITIETVVLTIDGLDRDGVEQLIAQDCIRPAGAPGAWLFREIDVARLRLIQDLRRTLALGDEALPVVLHLLDQLYAARRRLLRLREAVELTAPPDVHRAILNALSVAPTPVSGEGATRWAG
jgi:chaperone modulatory protein CbpM